mgnify:CR=1 FL=1
MFVLAGVFCHLSISIHRCVTQLLEKEAVGLPSHIQGETCNTKSNQMEEEKLESFISRSSKPPTAECRGGPEQHPAHPKHLA